MNSYFHTHSSGLIKPVQAPRYGQQDVGIAPGGAMDRFACESGRMLLGDYPEVQTWEILIAPRIQFEADLYFVLTGAPHQPIRLQRPSGQLTDIKHARVYRATQGSHLDLGEKRYGFRAYLSILAVAAKEPHNLAGRERAPYERICNFGDPDGRIRVLPGPEHAELQNPQDFWRYAWRTTQEMSDMGMRLESAAGVRLAIHMPGMISAPVADGTVQLTPNGPIILLRHRQTVGGYPRIFNVISADIDRLAQFAPEQIIWFKTVTPAQAVIAARRRQMALDALRRQYASS